MNKNSFIGVGGLCKEFGESQIELHVESMQHLAISEVRVLTSKTNLGGISAMRKSGNRRTGRKIRLSPSLRRFLQSAKMFLLLSLGLLILSSTAAKLVKPYIIYRTENKEIAEIQKQIAAEKAENTRLKRELRDLDTRLGKEVEARKQGWVKPGEVAVILEPPDDSHNSEPTPEIDVQKSTWQKICHAVGRIFTSNKP